MFTKYCVTLDTLNTNAMRDVDVWARDLKELGLLMKQIMIPGEVVFMVSKYINPDGLDDEDGALMFVSVYLDNVD